VVFFAVYEEPDIVFDLFVELPERPGVLLAQGQAQVVIDRSGADVDHLAESPVIETELVQEVGIEGELDRVVFCRSGGFFLSWP